jgi:UDP-N-acetylmuramoyl-L-alanyl-D-glutamate--2,6-diaminopimelate ligase
VLLSELAKALGFLACGETDPEITGLTEDSRVVKDGYMFVAVKGAVNDGREYIEQAIKNGASSLLVSPPDNPNWSSRIIVPIDKFRKNMVLAARLVYGEPAEKLKIVGITGTNGKTTTCYLLEEILAKAGISTGVLGTINFRWPQKVVEAPNTTPDAPLLQSILSEMVLSGCSHAIMEVSSHALELGRIEGLKFEAALFSNLSRDHLDFHGDMESYYLAKKRLFTQYLKFSAKKIGLVNSDDLYGSRLSEELSAKVYSYGFNNNPDIKGYNLKCSKKGISFDVEGCGEILSIKSPLIGSFNASNLLGVVALSKIMEISVEAVKSALNEAKGPPGRLERVGQNDDFLALVDYSHTPGALISALEALRVLNPRRLMVIFGCGGDRDKGKRPLMAEAAAKYSDLAILTSDNPRTESPLSIISDTEKGFDKASEVKLTFETAKTKKGYFIEADREKAINRAVELMLPGDILLVAGKGHETYQIIGREKRPFDDRIVTQKAMESMGKAG